MKVSLIIPALLAINGYRKQSLSLSGSVTAFIVGVLTFSAPLKAFGITMIVFYLVGSKATKVGKSIKERLEDGHHEAGKRDAFQVLSNSFTAVIAASIWSACFASDSLHASIAKTILGNNYTTWKQFHGSEWWCAIDPIVASGWSRTLVLTALGHFACCCGDTLASELGILSRSPPILITTFKRVPPGTNGGISAMGTGASVLGGAIIGMTMGITLFFENTTCFAKSLSPIRDLAALGAFAGGLGSMIDSLLGATVQRTQYSTKTKLILQDHHKAAAGTGKEIKVISGLNILTNNQVNVVSSVLTALILGFAF